VLEERITRKGRWLLLEGLKEKKKGGENPAPCGPGFRGKAITDDPPGITGLHVAKEEKKKKHGFGRVARGRQA